MLFKRMTVDDFRDEFFPDKSYYSYEGFQSLFDLFDEKDCDIVMNDFGYETDADEVISADTIIDEWCEYGPALSGSAYGYDEMVADYGNRVCLTDLYNEFVQEDDKPMSLDDFIYTYGYEICERIADKLETETIVIRLEHGGFLVDTWF